MADDDDWELTTAIINSLETAQQEMGNHSVNNPNNLIEYTWNEIKQSTNNFHQSNLLGQGGFAKVYRARSLRGRDCAVKVLNAQRNISGRREIRNLASIAHINAARILGYAVQGQQQNAIVTVYYPNGCVGRYITSSSEQQRRRLIAGQRIKIALQIATCVQYLHTHRSGVVLHNDLKPENVLLDSSFDAKVADFGISKEYKALEYNTHVQTMQLAYTPGYAAPELLNRHERSKRTDIFSLGILFIQLATDTRPHQFDDSRFTSYRDYIQHRYQNNPNQLKSVAFQGSHVHTTWRSLMNLGLEMCHPLKNRRGELSTIVTRLRQLSINTPAVPVQGQGNDAKVNQVNNTTRSSTVTSTEDGNLCTLCYINPKNCRFRPCGHAMCCSQCAHRISNRRCPICQQPFTEFVIFTVNNSHAPPVDTFDPNEAKSVPPRPPVQHQQQQYQNQQNYDPLGNNDPVDLFSADDDGQQEEPFDFRPAYSRNLGIRMHANMDPPHVQEQARRDRERRAQEERQQRTHHQQQQQQHHSQFIIMYDAFGNQVRVPKLPFM